MAAKPITLRAGKLTHRGAASRPLGSMFQPLIVGAAILAALSAPGAAYAEALYAIQGPRGSITFTSRTPPAGAHYRIVTPATPRRSPILRIGGVYNIKARSSDYEQMITDTAREHEVEAALVKAMVHVESAFNPTATSGRGAMGLMQLMPGTAQRFGVKNAYEPNENVAGGVRYIKLLLRRYNGNVALALAAYNAGEGAVDQLKTIPPYSETQSYIRKVLSALEVYRCVDAGNRSCGS